MVAGELERDAVWEGDVELGGDVVVPAGVTLRVLPGARLSFSPRPRWACSVFRSAPEGYPIEASSRELCDLVVFGRLEAAEAAFGADGARWGGLTVLGGGRARLSGCRLAGGEEHLAQVFDDGALEAEGCAFSDARVGVLAWGLSRVTLRGGRFERLESCVLCREGSVAELTGVSCGNARQGVWTQQWSVARLSGCSLSECSDFGAGAFERSRLLVDGGSIGACGRPLVRSPRARLEARGLGLEAVLA